MAIALGTSAKKLRLGSATPSRLYAGSTAFWDSDAAAYTAAVEAADGQSLELGVVAAYHNFILGCKADGIFSAIKASCILCGARTLAGALVPLVGAAPTNVADGFVSGDYTRGGATPGLKGDGTSYLDTNASADEYGQDDAHGAVFTTTKQTVFGNILFGNSSGGGFIMFPAGANLMQIAVNYSSGVLNVSSLGIGNEVGLIGCTRSSSSEISYVAGSQSATIAQVSTTPLSENFGVFARSTGAFISDPTIAFYSFGNGLGASGLAALDARVTALVTAIGAAV